MKFVRVYDIETDEEFQCPVSEATAAAAEFGGALVTPLPTSDLPVKSRYRSERHLVWTTPEQWQGTLS